MFHFQEQIKRLQEQHLFRSLLPIDSEPSTVIEQNGRKCLLFCSNNYLGLANHPALKTAAMSAIKSWGIGAGASRLISGNIDINRSLELRLAQFKKTESALVFNSGYMANLGAISAIIGKSDLILADRLNHASLVDGCRLSKGKFRVYRHKDTEQLRKLLSSRGKNQNTLIVTDGVFSMDGDLAPLPEILSLAEQYEAFIYLDDAHGTGVLGPRGGGTCEHFNLSSSRIVQMGTFSKALGGFGGFIAGSDLLIKYLINKARPFIYTTALPPGVLATALAALDWVEENPSVRNQLWKNRNYLAQKLSQLGFDLCGSETPIVPIRIGSSEKALLFSQKLLQEGILIPAIRPPTVPVGTSRLRITLMATHTRDQIDFLLLLLEKIGKELRVL
jgi:8-amino-7-oxononanoate synthase